MTKSITTSLSMSSTIRENAALVGMYLLGAILVSLLWWPGGLIYLAYGIASNILHMAWVCPYCAHYAAGTCPAGYHLFFGGRFRPQPGKTFRGQFNRGVIVLAPGWFVPPLVGGYALVTGFSWLELALVLLFCLAAFVILPTDSQRHCRSCDNRDCPRWKG